VILLLDTFRAIFRKSARLRVRLEHRRPLHIGCRAVIHQHVMDDFAVARPHLDGLAPLRRYRFALRALRFVQQLPRTLDARTIGDRLLRSSTSVAANYRASCRGRTRKEFIAKIGVALEEPDESVFWLQLLIDGDIRVDREARTCVRRRRS
jgi:four helix bundle protein